MYDGIKAGTSPTATKITPLMSKTSEVTTDQGKQLERWMEHYLENVVRVAA
jgi:hypothetical protein